MQRHSSMNYLGNFFNKSRILSAHNHLYVKRITFILSVFKFSFKFYLFVVLKHTMFRSPRHLDFVYMYIIMLDMYFCS